MSPCPGRMDGGLLLLVVRSRGNSPPPGGFSPPRLTAGRGERGRRWSSSES